MFPSSLTEWSLRGVAWPLGNFAFSCFHRACVLIFGGVVQKIGSFDFAALNTCTLPVAITCYANTLGSVVNLDLVPLFFFTRS